MQGRATEDNGAEQLVRGRLQDDHGQPARGRSKGFGHRRVGERAGKSDDADPLSQVLSCWERFEQSRDLLAKSHEGEQVYSNQPAV